MKEIITIGVGGCGITLADSLIKQSALEHNIDISTGKLEIDQIDNYGKSYPLVLFNEKSENYYVPRSIFVDSVPDERD